MKLKTFKEYVVERQTDPDLVIKMQEEQNEAGDECPRCGKQSNECACVDRDYGSTINLYRLGKGKITKQKSNFKKEE